MSQGRSFNTFLMPHEARLARQPQSPTIVNCRSRPCSSYFFNAPPHILEIAASDNAGPLTGN